MTDRGCVFFNFGTKCLNMLFVALFTLRRHYDGAVTVLLTGVPDEEDFRASLSSLDIDFRSFSRAGYHKCSLRAKIEDLSPYRTTLIFDSDLLFLDSPEPLWQPTEDSGILVTRFHPNPYGIGGSAEQPGFAYRLGHFNEVSHLVNPEDFKRATTRLLEEGIDINVGVMGFTRPQANNFLVEFSESMKADPAINLIDESLTNVLITKYSHYLADEKWNCPADEMFRKTPLSDAKIVHYFGDGCVVDGRRLGRNHETEAGKLWFKTFDEMREQLPIQQWTEFEILP